MKKKYRIEVTDSYRNLRPDYWKNLGQFYTDNVWDRPLEESEEYLREVLSTFESEYAVKWFELAAYREDRMVGFMRVLRDPEDETVWFFCDVHAARSCRHKGIATAMYEEAFALVSEFGAAEYVIASVSAANIKSIGLHEKFGFRDTGEYPAFANFTFEEDETMFECQLLTELPVTDGVIHRRILQKLFRAYYKAEGLEAPKSIAAEVRRKLETCEEFVLIWCGNRPVGFRYRDGEKEVRFTEEA